MRIRAMYENFYVKVELVLKRTLKLVNIPEESWLNCSKQISLHLRSPYSSTCASVKDTEHCANTNISQYNISLVQLLSYNENVKGCVL